MMKTAVTMSAAISFLAIAPIAYMAADNEPPYEYDVGNSYVVPSHPRVEHQVTVHWALKKINRVCPGSIVRYIIDVDTRIKTTYDATAAASSVESGDYELDRSFMLPPNVTPGLKIYRAEGFYVCNPLQHFWPLRAVTPDLRFEVIE